MPSTDTRIRDVTAWEALDSRGDPTVGCCVTVGGGRSGRAIVPAGASTGTYEAPELRDGGRRLNGRGVRLAVAVVNDALGPAVIGMDASDQHAVDVALRQVIPPAHIGHLGSNSTLAVSVASALASAAAQRTAAWCHFGGARGIALPMPMIQILTGGIHAGRVIDIQDVLVIPTDAGSFPEAVEMAGEIRRSASRLAEPFGPVSHLVGAEGGLALPFKSNRAAVEFVGSAIEGAGLASRAHIAIDVAANQLLSHDSRYHLGSEGRILEPEEWLEELEGWVRDLPIISLEDPLGDDDWDGWLDATRRFAGIQLVGDDLFATDADRLAQGMGLGVANAVLVKPNQRGTLSEAAAVVERARSGGYRVIVSGRSGETEDSWLADLALGWGADQFKVGSLMRSERLAKWNRLLEISATEPQVALARPFRSSPTHRSLFR